MQDGWSIVGAVEVLFVSLSKALPGAPDVDAVDDTGRGSAPHMPERHNPRDCQLLPVRRDKRPEGLEVHCNSGRIVGVTTLAAQEASPTQIQKADR